MSGFFGKPILDHRSFLDTATEALLGSKDAFFNSFSDTTEATKQAYMQRLQTLQGPNAMQDPAVKAAMDFSPMAIAGIKLTPALMDDPGYYIVDRFSKWAKNKEMPIATLPSMDDLRGLFDEARTGVLRILRDKDTNEIVAAWGDDTALHDEVIAALQLKGKYNHEFLNPEDIGLPKLGKKARSFFEEQFKRGE